MDPHETSISCQELRAQAFGQSDVAGVVGAQPVAKLPDARNERLMGMALDWDGSEASEQFLGIEGCRLALQDQAATGGRKFDVEEVGCSQRELGLRQGFLSRPGDGPECVYQRTRVGDGQCSARSWSSA